MTDLSFRPTERILGVNVRLLGYLGLQFHTNQISLWKKFQILARTRRVQHRGPTFKTRFEQDNRLRQRCSCHVKLSPKVQSGYSLLAWIDGANRLGIQEFKRKNGANYSKRHSRKEMGKVPSGSSAEVFNMICDKLCHKIIRITWNEKQWRLLSCFPWPQSWIWLAWLHVNLQDPKSGLLFWFYQLLSIFFASSSSSFTNSLQSQYISSCLQPFSQSSQLAWFQVQIS